MSVDFERLNRIFCGNKKSLSEYIKVYIDTTNKLLLDIETSIKEEDFAKLKMQIHNLKGSSGSGGMTTIYDLSIRLDAACDGKDFEKIILIVSDIRDALYKISEKFL